MGKTVEANAVISLNMEPARKKVEEFRQSVAAARQELKKLETTPVSALKKEDLTRMKELRKEIPRMEKELSKAEKSLKGFRDTLRHLDKASINDLTNAKRALNDQIRKLTPGTKEYIAATADYKKVNARLQSLNNAYKQVDASQKGLRSGISKLTDTFNKYFGVVTTTIAAVTGLSMAFRKSAQDAAAMDDMYAKVMKTTGLTKEEVEQLNDAFKEMDTRTAREQLNQMAYEAGKLGYQGVENIRQFVEAADIINVALGDVLGEGATLEIAKLAQVFAQSTAALENLDLKGRMLAVGSAINQLGKESTASESYMVDFLGRLGGVATQAGISADQILGYASALDQMKQKVEMSATAFQKLIQQMIKKPEEFVEAAKMPLEEFTKLMETDMNGAIKRVLAGFNEMGGFTQLVPLFKDMGLDGARAASVIASLAANLDKVSAAQATANEHIILGTSMTREYMIMNQSMQAQLEKARKEFKDASITLGQSLNPIMLKTTKLTTYLIKALVQYGKEIKAAAISIVVFTAAIKANTIATAMAETVTKGFVLIQKTLTVVVNAASYAFNIMRGRTIAATKAYLAMKAAMSTSVFGLIATAIAAVTVALVHYTKRAKEATEATKKMGEIEDRINSEYAESASQVQVLTDIVHNNNLAIDQRRDALKRLQEIVPAYHADLTKEGQLINDNTEALTIYLKNLEKVTRAKILEDEYTQATARVLKAEKDKEDAENRRLQALQNANGNTQEMTHITMQSSAGAFSVTELTPYGEAVRDVTAATNELTEAQQIQGQILQRIQQENGDAFATRHGEITAEEMEIRALNQEYEQLFQEIRDQNRDNPQAALDRIADLKVEQAKKIAEIRQKYREAVSGDENPEGDGGGGSGSGGDSQKKAFEARIKEIKQQYRRQEQELRLSLARQQIDQAEYEAQVYQAKAEYFRQQIDAARQYCQDETEIMNEFYDWQIQAIEKSQKQMQDIQDALAKADRARKKKEEDELVQDMQNRAKQMQREQEILQNNLAEVKERIGKDTWKEELAFEMWKLEELHNRGLVSERDYQLARLKIRMEYAQKAAEYSNQMAEYASNFVTQLKEMETAQLDAEYQAQLTAAGNNAEEREAIEAEYEQKKLDLQKKYADTEMVINIAKAIAAGALAAIEAFASAGNPILGAVFAAIIAATTALEVATIVKQRNAIKNTSVSGGGGSSSAPSTGQRTITGHAEGGFTENHTTLSTVGEEGTEWIAPHWMVRDNPTTFASLERYRRSGSHGRSGSIERGFADGGFTGAAPKDLSTESDAAIERAVFNGIRAALQNKWIRAFLVRQDITDMDNQDKRFKDQLTR